MKSRARALALAAQISLAAFAAAAPAYADDPPPAAPAPGPAPAAAATAGAATAGAATAGATTVAAAEPPAAPPSPPAAPPAPPQHADGDPSIDFRELLHLEAGPLSIAPVVLVQTQAIPYVGSDSFLQSGDPAERPGFRMRRARFGFGGRLYDKVPFRITGEFSSDEHGTAHLHDAYFGYDRFKFLQLFAGAREVPFSRSAMVDSGSGALIERPLSVRSMSPFHQLGLSAEGRLFGGAFTYAAGVYNGLERSDVFFEGYGENAALLGNRFDGLTYAARLGSEPMGDVGATIEDLRKGKPRLGVGASFFYSNGGTRNLLGAGGDVIFKAHGFHVLAEFLSNHASPKSVPTQPTTQISTVQSLAAVGEAGYVIVKNRLGVSARFEWIDPNTSLKDESDCWLAVGGISYHVMHDLVKAQLDYTHRQEIHGKSLKNDSVVMQFQLNL
jgi:Phosphate-selective porin O and P